MSVGTCTHRDKDTVELSGTCTVTGKVYSVIVTAKAYDAWRNGRMIQDIFPYLTEDQREFLVSWITPAEWAATFPEGEEDW